MNCFRDFFSMMLVAAIPLALLSITDATAQDRLFFLNGEEREVKITEVSPTEIKYREMGDAEGPVFIIPKAELFKVNYQSGRVEVIDQAKAAPTKQAAPANATVAGSVLIDKWGRTSFENRKIYRQKLTGGIVGMSAGAVFTGLAIPFIANAYTPFWDIDPVPSLVLGGILAVGATAEFVLGAINFGTMGKYKNRAEDLEAGISLRPTLLNANRYQGASVMSSPGYGVSVGVRF
jgi:hypothetical protein